MFFALILLTVYLEQIYGHGYLADPPARSSAWLYDADLDKCCQYFDHNQMSCGGTYHQWTLNGGKCSICGEPDDRKPKLFGVGDAMYSGKIVRTYTQGSVIPVTVVLTANHLGIFEFRLCSVDKDPSQDATQKCLDSNVLQVTNTSTQYPIEASYTIVHVNVTLPANFLCKHCVFQWKYRTGNSWGVSSTGKACLGCGRENEEFYGCSDIAIVNSSVPSNTNIPSKKVLATMPPLPRKCTSAVVFSQSYDLTNIMQQYCQTICSNNCTSDKKDGSEILYNGCVKSCNVLCACQ